LGDYFIQMLEWLSSGPSFRFLLKRNEHKGCLIRLSSRPESPEAAQGLLAAAAAQLLAASQRRLLAAAARRLMELVARRLMAAAALRPSRSVRFMQGSIHRTLFGAGSPGRRMVGGVCKKNTGHGEQCGRGYMEIFLRPFISTACVDFVHRALLVHKIRSCTEYSLQRHHIVLCSISL
jgi:hypothetical protein